MRGVESRLWAPNPRSRTLKCVLIDNKSADSGYFLALVPTFQLHLRDAFPFRSASLPGIA
jgi:hypothetical protein